MGYPIQSYESNGTITVTEDTKITFMKEVIEYIEIIKNFVPDELKEINNCCKEIFDRYTKPFFEKWAFLNIIEWEDRQVMNFYSFILEIHGSKLLLPHKILTYEILHPNNTLLSQLKKATNIEFFFFILYKIFRELDVPLRTSDLEIIETLSDPIIRKKIRNFPTNRQLSQITKISENTISRRLDLLCQIPILTTVYRVEMAQLGYMTNAIIHTNNINDIPPAIEPYCLIDVPIDWGETMAKIKILQVPYTRKDIFTTIDHHFNPLFDITLSKSYLGWNLNGLTKNCEQRWQVLPPIFLGEDWTDHVLSEGSGIEYNLFNDMSVQRITKTQARMLDLLQNGTAPNKHLSTTLGITPKYVKDFFDYFFSINLITRFPVFSNIGLNSKVWITLISSPNNKNEDLIENIVEHLKFFPFCCLFYNERSLDQKGRLILTGILWIPDSWFVDFYGVWIHLIDEGFIPKINISQGVIKWGLNIADTYNFSIIE